MLKNKQGFSLVELIVVMAIFVIVIAVTGNAFNKVVSQATQQSRTAEGNIEGVVGLEIMRKDIASAGFGLPWAFTTDPNYQEAADTETLAKAYNDKPNDVPRAICGSSISAVPAGTTYIKDSDYLVIKATNIGMSQAAQRWTYMNYTGVVKPPTVKPFAWPSDNLANGDLVTVVRVGLTSTFTKELVVGGGNFWTKYNKDGLASVFEPNESRIAYYVYGISPSDTSPSPSTLTSLRMPFNRADYYVRIPADTELPNRCASNTGILYKAMVSHNDGALQELPLLDCVADMQVVYLLDKTGTGSMEESGDISLLTAQEIREQLKAVKVYVLTHDGGKDRSYSYPNTTIDVGPAGTGKTFDFATSTIADYRNYRWKVYFMTVKPENVNVATQ